MKKFKSNYKVGEIEIPTSSLPDIIFMLLFFFMVTTVLRDHKEQLQYLIPDAQQLKKIEKASLVSEIKVGTPLNESQGVEPTIEAGGKLIHVEDIGRFVLEEKEKLPQYYQDKQIVLLKADKDIEMGLILDIQQELRKINARKIVYASSKKRDKTAN